MTKKRGNNEGSIYQRGDTGIWMGAITIYDEAGNPKRKTITGKTRSEVAKKLTALKHQQDQGLAVTIGKSQTVRQFLTEWLEHTVKSAVRPRTHESYAAMVRLHIIPELGRLE